MDFRSPFHIELSKRGFIRVNDRKMNDSQIIIEAINEGELSLQLIHTGCCS